MQRQANDQAGEPLIDQDRPIAIVPIEHEQPRFPRLERRRLVRKLHMIGFCRAARHDHVDKPIENVPHGRLPGFQAKKSRQHRAIDNTANPRHVGDLFAVGGNGQIAGRGAHDFHERARRNARADGAQMHIERADRHRNAGFQPQFVRPSFRQRAGRIGNGVHFVRQRFAHSLQSRIERFQKLHVGISAPVGVDKMLCARPRTRRVSLATV